MNYAKLLILAIFLSISSGTVLAQKQWTLQECVDYAYKNNLTLKQKQLSIAAAKVNVTEAKMRVLPNLNASVSHGYNFGRSIDPFTNTFTVQNISNSRFGVSSSVVLFNGFQILNNIKMQQQLLQASTFDLEVSANDIGLSISNAFLQVLFAQELVRISDEQVSTTREQLERTQRFLDAGRVAESAVLDIKAQLANDELALVNARNQLANANLTLFQLMDLGPEGNEVIAPQFDSVPDPGVLNAQQLYASYVLNSAPELKAADSRMVAGTYAWKVARSGYYPRLILMGDVNTVYSESYKRATGYSTLYYYQIYDPSYTPIGYLGYTQPTGTQVTPFNDQLSQNLGQTLGFSLSIPIFNNYSSIASVKRAQFDMESARINRQITDNTIRRQITQAYTDYLSARARFEASRASYEAQLQSFDYAEKRYNSNLLGSADYRLQKNNLQSAQSTFLQAKYELMFRYKIIEFYKNGQIRSVNN